jgi:hypothetical protein
VAQQAIIGEEVLQQDFAAPPLQDGAWNRSTHVSAIISRGFSIQVDITKRGKKPPALRLRDADEREYIAAMIRDGILEEGTVTFTNPHFFIRVPGKLRLIFDGRRINKAVKKPPRFVMRSHKTVQRYVRLYKFHSSDDLKNMFFSVPLETSTRESFGIRLEDGRTLRYTRLPFGFNWSPFVAHVVVDQVCQRAREEGHEVMHYLDDFHYFGDTPEEVDACRARVRQLLREAAFRINFKKYQPTAQVFEALGLEYDMVAKTTRLPHRKLHDLRDVILQWHSTRRSISMRMFASALGLLVFGNIAYPGFLSELQPSFYFLRKCGLNWSDTLSPELVSSHLLRAVDKALALQWFPLQHAPEPTHVYTDATTTQIGFQLPTTAGAARIQRTTIYKAEALAVLWTLYQPDLPLNTLLRIDNEALHHAVQKGRSNIPEANAVCRRIFQLRSLGFRIHSRWIPTDKNPADHWSRLSLPPAHRELRSPLFVSSHSSCSFGTLSAA